MSKDASLLGYRHGRERNLGSSYFCFGVVFLFVFFFLVVLFVWFLRVFWVFLLFVFVFLFCFLGFFFLVLFWFRFLFGFWVCLFFFMQGCGEGKPNKKPLTFLQLAQPQSDKAEAAGVDQLM